MCQHASIHHHYHHWTCQHVSTNTTTIWMRVDVSTTTITTIRPQLPPSPITTSKATTVMPLWVFFFFLMISNKFLLLIDHDDNGGHHQHHQHQHLDASCRITSTTPQHRCTQLDNDRAQDMYGVFFFLLHFLLTFIYFRLHTMMATTTTPSRHVTHLSPRHLDHHHCPLGRCSSGSGSGRSSRSNRRGSRRAAGATNTNRTRDASASQALVCFYFIYVTNNY